MSEKTKLSIDDLQSILESVLFTMGRPVSFQELSWIFENEKIPALEIKKALFLLSEKYEQESCGIELKQVSGAWQLRTKEENKHYIRRLVKGRLFQLSAPALEVLVIVAYRQPCKKATIDEIRGVESGHLLRTLMEKGLICFGPKSTDPGRYITYKTTAQFLEVFGLKNIKDLPSSADIKDLLSSADDSLVSEEGLETVLAEFKNVKKEAYEQKMIVDELAVVSNEISSVNPKIYNSESNLLKSNEKEKN